MKLRCYIALVTLIFTSNVLSALPDYITKETFSKICSKNYCSDNLSSEYVTTYFHKQFHKALALSYSKSGNRYSVDYVFWSYQYPTSVEAKSAALNGCKKSANNCEIFLVNNSYVNESLLNKLNNKINYSSSKIPSNAYKSGNGWKCKSGFYKNKSYCAKLPTGAAAYGTGDGFYCKSGFKKSGLQCIKRVNIPNNAYSASNSQGWKCKSLYYQNNNSCLRLPSNAIAKSHSDGFYCKTGYEKYGSGCRAKINQDDAYEQAERAYDNGDYQKAFREFSLLANEGSMEAQNFIAYMYENGEGISENLKLAFSWYRKAALQGFSLAQCNLGYLYEKGRGTAKDFNQAVNWYRKAANQGNSRCQNNLGLMYDLGNGVVKDYQEAFRWYLKAANQGNEYGQYNLGLLYEYGNGVSQNFKLALSWYQKASDQGHSSSKEKVKAIQSKIKSNEDKAKINIPNNAYASSSDPQGWKCKSLYYQSNNSCLRLPSNASAYGTGDGFYCKSGFKKSGLQCIKRVNIPNNAYSASNSQGWKCKSLYYQNNNSCLRLPSNAIAKSHSDGFYCKTGYEKYGSGCRAKINQDDAYQNAISAYEIEDYQKAFREFLILAKVGNKKAQNYLGYMYEHAKGVEADLKQAFNWYQKSAIQGYSLAQCNLGYFYEKGQGIAKDYKQAISWYRKSANQGNSRCQNNLGLMYEWGYGVTKDYHDAFGWYLKSANQGNEYGQYNLGLLYEYGNGVSQNFKLALSWYQKASDQGHSSAKEKVKTIQSKIKPNNNNQSNQEVLPASSGSGFAVTSDGYVITNHHVIDGCNNVEIINRGKAISATVVSFDENNDLALLKSNFKPLHTFPLSRNNPYTLMEIYVAGYPFGYDISTPIKITEGIVSSLAGIGNNFSQIQIDAAVQPGNSGGPIIDSKGNVVGVVVSKLDLEKMMENYGVVPEGTNFGIKSNVVINFLESNNVELIEVNNEELPKKTLGKNISNGTYYISCLMTMAQINKMKEKKAFFSNIQ